MLTPTKSISHKFIFHLLIGAFLLSTVFFSHSTVQAEGECQCVKYIQNRYSLFFGIGNGGAKSMGPYLIARGFKQVGDPQVGAVVIFQPAFGAVDQTNGHVGVITKVEERDSNSKWKIWVRGANQEPAGTENEYNCTNINDLGYKAYPKNWGADRISYYVPPTGFNSPFTNGASGWTAVTGTWSIDTSSGFYINAGGPQIKWHTIKHSSKYSTLTYEAKIKRSVCPWCANHLAIRGNPSSLSASELWKNVYIFEYQNRAWDNYSQGAWSVWKEKDGVEFNLGGWTASPYISQYGWNTLKVTAKANNLKFYINGHLVWSGTDPDFITGQTGIGMYQYNTTDTKGKLYVDWAKLTPALVTSNLSNETIPLSSGPVSDADINGYINK